MPNVDITVDAKPMGQLPADPNVKVPPSVARASAAADVMHQQAYQTTQTPAPQPPQPEPVAQPVAQPVPQPSPTPADPRASWTVEQWRQFALTQDGRVRSMQTQMNELSGELMLATQHNQQQNIQTQPDNSQISATKRLTDKDEETYGADFLDVAKRAALDAVTPEISRLAQENQQLRRNLQRQNVNSVGSVLDVKVPNWRQINVDPAFKAWLRLPDIYSGQLRINLLNAAYKAADGPRVAVFFEGFLRENPPEFSPTEQSQPLVQPLPAPRTPALDISALATPGRANPPVGTMVPTQSNDLPFITHAQISTFYSEAGRKAYTGREQDRMRDEQMIFDYQRRGLVR